MYIGVIESHTALMAVFVDDILLASTCEDVTVHVKSLFHAQFALRTWDLHRSFCFLTSGLHNGLTLSP